LSPNQLVGLIVGSGVLTTLTILEFVSDRVGGRASQVLDGLQMGGSFSVFDLNSFGVAEQGHFADFARGILSVPDIVYYISMTGVFLVMTVLVLEVRRWK
jgi:ABC-2 type transport system permease protein